MPRHSVSDPVGSSRISTVISTRHSFTPVRFSQRVRTRWYAGRCRSSHVGFPKISVSRPSFGRYTRLALEITSQPDLSLTETSHRDPPGRMSSTSGGTQTCTSHTARTNDTSSGSAARTVEARCTGVRKETRPKSERMRMGAIGDEGDEQSHASSRPHGSLVPATNFYQPICFVYQYQPGQLSELPLPTRAALSALPTLPW